MAADQFANNYSTTLNGSITASSTAITLTSATGAPTAPFRVLIDSEIIYVGARSGTSCTSLTRGAESTTAASHSSGGTVTHVLTAGALANLGYTTTTGGGKDTVSVVTTAGTAQTVDLATANVFDLTLTSASCAITVTGATSGVLCSATVILRQDGTGGRAVTWATTVAWTNAAAPVLATSASAVAATVVLWTRDGGTTWYGSQVGTITEAGLSLSDVTTANVSTSAHGFAPKAPNDATKYLNGTGAWSVPSGGSGITAGTAFPGSPSTNDLYFRTDLGLLCYYTGSSWMTVQISSQTLVPDSAMPLTATGQLRAPVAQFTYSMYVLDWTSFVYPTTTQSGSNYWALQLNSTLHGATTATALGSATDTKTDTANVFSQRGVSGVNATVAVSGGSKQSELELVVTKNGTPTSIYIACQVRYRLIVT